MAHNRRLRVEPLEDRRLLAITVNTLVDELDGSIVDGDVSLRDAIAAAPAGETIDFSVTGTIKLTLGELKIDKALTISGPTLGTLTIDASGNDPTPELNNGDGSRIFNFENATSLLNNALRNLILTGGDVTGDGGAIRSVEDLSVSNLSVENNSASNFGGGIYSGHANLTVNASILSANRSSFRGGGLAQKGGSTILSDSVVSGNSGLGGGGLFNEYGLMTIEQSRVSGNTATEIGGGGIRNYKADLIIDRSYVEENTASYGAGIRSNIGNVTITNSSISNNVGGLGGGVGDGGGINMQYGDLTISSSAISGNTAQTRGGGIYTFVGTTRITASSIANNYTTSSGGGVYSHWTRLYIDGCTISHNVARGGGGGIFHDSGSGVSAQISNSLVFDNHAGGTGGIGGWGIRINATKIIGNTATHSGGGLGGSGLKVVDSLVDGNVAGTDGGGIHSYHFELTRCIISRNVAGRDGGGIGHWRGGLNIFECTISGNSAGEDGGGVWAAGSSASASESSVNIANSTISGNSANYNGGGISNDGSAVTITSSTVSGNSAVSGGGVFSIADDSRDFISLNHTIVANSLLGADIYHISGPIGGFYNLIEDGSGGTGFVTGFLHTITGDPLLAPLGNNGGPTMTHALLHGSPAIDTGDPSIWFDPDQFDQRGPGFDRVSNGRIDIGAFEVQSPPIGDFDADGDVDGRDFLAWQRNPSVGDLSDWQEEYGENGLLVASGELIDEGTEDWVPDYSGMTGDELLVASSELLVASGELRVEEGTGVGGQGIGAIADLRLGNAEWDEGRELVNTDPGDATPGLGVVLMERPAIRSDRGYEFLVGERFVEAVDRVIEQWNASTILLGKPAVAPFGEMVARRGIASPQETGDEGLY